MQRQVVPFALPVLILMLLLVMAVGTFYSDADGIWFDEWFSLYNAGAPPFSEPLSPTQIWERVANEDPWQTPGYPLLLSAWGNLIGWSEGRTRLLSAFAGLIAVSLTYRFALALSRDRMTGIGAAGLMAGSAWFLFYTHEMRVYTLYMAATVAFLFMYWRVAQRPHAGWISNALVTLSAILLVYSHPFGLLTVGVVGVWHVSRLLTRKGRRGWWRASAALLVAGILFLPWAAVLIRVSQQTRDIQRYTVDGNMLLQDLFNMVFVLSSTSSALFVIFAYYSLQDRRARPLWAWFALLLFLTGLALYVLHINELRYGLALLPLLALIGGFGVAALHRRRVPAALILTVWALPGLFYANDPRLGMVIQNNYPQPIREMAGTLRPYLDDESAVINYLGDTPAAGLQLHPLSYYFGDHRVSILEMATSQTYETFIQRFEGGVGDADRVWVLTSAWSFGREWGLVEHLLHERGFSTCRTLDGDGYRIHGYAAVEEAIPPLQFSDQASIRLIGQPDVIEDRVVAWVSSSVNAAPDQYSMGVYLMDGAGAVISQYDTGIGAGNACVVVALPLNGVALDQTTVRVSVYDWRTGERLPAMLDDGAADTLPVLASFDTP